MKALYYGLILGLSSLGYASETIQSVADQPVAVIFNHLTVDTAPTERLPMKERRVKQVGHIQLQLASKSNVDVPAGEHIPALHAVSILDGLVFVEQHAGHWQVKSLPKTCQVTVPLGTILEIQGRIDAQYQLHSIRCISRPHVPDRSMAQQMARPTYASTQPQSA